LVEEVAAYKEALPDRITNNKKIGIYKFFFRLEIFTTTFLIQKF